VSRAFVEEALGTRAEQASVVLGKGAVGGVRDADDAAIGTGRTVRDQWREVVRPWSRATTRIVP
jgi:hypothetical protein